jgi:branched-chain amino acid transport system substrate-binding protein
MIPGMAHSTRADILIGVATPLTGQYEYIGEQTRSGTDLAVKELNTAGGVLGQRVMISLIDDFCDADQAVAAARKLVADKVVVAIGHNCSGAAIPASEVYEAARVPFIAPDATNPLLTERGLRLTFRPTLRDDTQGSFAAEHMVRRLGARRIAILHDTRTYGRGLAEVARKRLVELGAPEVLFEAVQPDQQMFADLVGRLQQAAVDAVYYGGYQREGALLRRQMGEAGFTPPLMAGEGINGEDYGLIAGPAADGTLMTDAFIPEGPEVRAFEARYEAAYGVVPYGGAFAGYRGVMIWAQAVAAAGATDATTVADALRRESFEFLGLKLGFDAKGDVTGPLAGVSLWVWRDGKPMLLR